MNVTSRDWHTIVCLSHSYSSTFPPFSNDLFVSPSHIIQKERDLELAARIGQSLLDQNRSLKSRNDVLENELAESKESVSQSLLLFHLLCFA